MLIFFHYCADIYSELDDDLDISDNSSSSSSSPLKESTFSKLSLPVCGFQQVVAGESGKCHHVYNPVVCFPGAMLINEHR